LRLIGSALVACWAASGGLLLLTYRPGGPLDLVVGLTALGPIAIAIAGVVWPPVARGDRAFSSIMWLGIGGLLCLVPSIVGLVNQLTAYGSQTLLPSIEAVYPWLLALVATSLFAGIGVARRVHGGTALRRRRLVAGIAVALLATGISGGMFGAVAIANDVALRDRSVASSRFGPTGGPDQPPFCDTPLATGTSARLRLDLSGTVDFRPIGSVELSGLRVESDFRWLAYVATIRQLGQYGSARIGERAWVRTPSLGWRTVAAETVAADSLDVQALSTALTPDYRATAEDRGVEVLEGARARRCRIAIDGPTFEATFPQVRWLVGSADLRRWRGQLDYWVFLDGQVGQVAGSVNGEAVGVVPDALQATVELRLTATERGRSFVIHTPTR
ncbi:MAG: hypothetical protein WEE50_08425, partial [Chloroflexota bacterium]